MSGAAIAQRTRSLDLTWIQDRGVYVGLIALVVVNLLISRNFATVENLRVQLIQVAPVAIVALGMALVIGTKGIDLSVGSTMAIAAALLPLYLGYGPWVAIVIATGAGAVAGAINGTLVAYVRIQPIIATLGLLVAGRGIALVIANGRLTEIFDPTLSTIGSGSMLGIPISVLVAGSIAILVAALMRGTTFGRHVVAIGGNPEASVLAGVPVRRTLMSVYIICGLLAALAGVLQTARSGASDPSFVGNLIELSAITAVVVGGTPLSGGRVRVLGTLAGAMMMQLITATLITHNLPDSTTRIVAALIILGAVWIQRERGGT